MKSKFLLLTLGLTFAVCALAEVALRDRVIPTAEQKAVMYDKAVPLKKGLEQVVTVIDSQGCYWHVMEGNPGKVALQRATTGNGHPICSR